MDHFTQKPLSQDRLCTTYKKCCGVKHRLVGKRLWSSIHYVYRGLGKHILQTLEQEGELYGNRYKRKKVLREWVIGFCKMEITEPKKLHSEQTVFQTPTDLQM